MRQKDVIAVIQPRASLLAPPELTVLAMGEAAVILAKRGLILRRGRRALAKAALERQLWLEALLPQGTVIPALPGTRLNEAEVPTMMAANKSLFDRLAQDLTGQVQFQLTIRCDAEAAQAAMQATPGPWRGAKTGADWTHAFNAHLRTQLEAAQPTRIEALPRAGDVVANLALLVPALEEPTLDRILTEIDSLWSDGLAIRLVGPSPAVSFASFGLKPITQTALAAAAKMLKLDGISVPQEALLAARQAALKGAVAPPADIRAAVDCLARAQALKAPGPYPMAFLWSEGQSAAHPRCPQADAA